MPYDSIDAVKKVPDGFEAATLAFGSLNKITDDVNGDTIFHDVTLLAEGTWTDGYSRQATRYTGNELAKMRFEKVTQKMDHDIFGTLPLTNEIGIIENPRFVRDPVAKWLGDVRIYPTQNGKDTATLLKRGQITDISSELFLKPVTNSKTKVVDATDMIFMGAATVRQGACTICKFNEGITNMMAEDIMALDRELRALATGCADPDLPSSAYAWVEDPEKKTTWHLPYKGMDGKVRCECVRAAIAAIAGARTGQPMAGVPDSAKAKLRSAAKTCGIETELGVINMTEDNTPAATDGNSQDAPPITTPGLAELEEGINDKVAKSVAQTAAEYQLAQGRIIELEAVNTELKTKVTMLENDTAAKIKQLTQKLDTLSKQPVVHTVVTGAAGGAVAAAQSAVIELDSGEFPAHSAMDFSED